MTASNTERLALLIHQASEIYQREISQVLFDCFSDLLTGYDYAAIEKAFLAHFASSKFFPTPADIIEKIPCHGNRHPGENEAWGIALVAFDETASVMYTDEIAEAMGAAREIYYTGDMVAARMAFKDAYKRAVAAYPSPQWRVSLGYDRGGREAVVANALAMGIVGEAYAMEELPNYVPKDPALLERYRQKQQLLLN